MHWASRYVPHAAPYVKYTARTDGFATHSAKSLCANVPQRRVEVAVAPQTDWKLGKRRRCERHRRTQSSARNGRATLTFRAEHFQVKNDELKKMIRDVDSDASGQIEFPEFLQIMTAKVSESDSKEDIRKIFRLFDKDGTGERTVAHAAAWSRAWTCARRTLTRRGEGRSTK